MRKIESGYPRMSKPFGAVAPSFKPSPSVPLFHGGCTVLSIQPSTSVLSEKALAALKYAFLKNQKVGITGARIESLKPPCDSDLEKAEAAYSIARELVEWSEKFVIDDNKLKLHDDHAISACLETKDDHKMSDKASDAGFIDAKDDKDDNDFLFRARIFGELKDPEIKGDRDIKRDRDIKGPDIKLEIFDEFKEIESRSGFPCFEKNVDLPPVKTESAGYYDSGAGSARRLPVVAATLNALTAETTPDFLKDTGCDSFDFFKSEDADFSGINFLSYSADEPMNSLDDLTQHTVDIDLAFPVPPLPIPPAMFSKMDSEHDLSSPIESPHSPFLLSPFSTSPHSPPFPNFPDS